MDDLISRQAAMEALNEWESQLTWDAWCYDHKNEAEKYNILAPTAVIEALPSAQIRCKDCAKREHCRTSTVWAIPPKDDWYCADAERRTDE